MHGINPNLLCQSSCSPHPKMLHGFALFNLLHLLGNVQREGGGTDKTFVEMNSNYLYSQP